MKVAVHSMFARGNNVMKAAVLVFGMFAFAVSGAFAHNAGAVAVDTQAPTTPGVPSTTTPTRNATMVWNWTASTDLPSDPTVASGLKGYQYELTTGSGTVISDWTDTTATTATTNAPYDDIYQLHVRAVDNAGNVSTESVGSAQLDQLPPSVAITSPTNGTTVDASKKITISGTSADAVSYTLSIGKTGQAPVASTSGTTFSSYVWDTTNVPGGSYIASLSGTDAAGNVGISEVLINVPGGVVVAPTTVSVNTAKYTSRPIVITGTVSTDATNLYITILDSKGKTVETGTLTLSAQTKWSYTTKTNLANGTYTVQARAAAPGTFVDAKANITVAVPQCWFFSWLFGWIFGDCFGWF